MKKYLTLYSILVIILAMVCLGATYQKYSKNVFYYTEFKTNTALLEFLNNQKNLVYVQVVPEAKIGLYYGVKIYLEKCIYGCDEK